MLLGNELNSSVEGKAATVLTLLLIASSPPDWSLSLLV